MTKEQTQRAFDEEAEAERFGNYEVESCYKLFEVESIAQQRKETSGLMGLSSRVD